MFLILFCSRLAETVEIININIPVFSDRFQLRNRSLKKIRFRCMKLKSKAKNVSKNYDIYDFQ
jgi:hypothetical protein